jgi:hypothetical protein
MAVLPMGTYPGYRSQYHTAKESIGHHRVKRKYSVQSKLKNTKIERVKIVQFQNILYGTAFSLNFKS